MTWTEILGFVTGAASVLLAVRESAWNWPVGIANNIFFLILFWKAKLYADAVLQIVYIVISIFGWWNWLRGGVGHTELPISRTGARSAILLAAATAAATVLLALALRRFTDSVVPFWDGITTALSLTAQYMLSRKLLENWRVWMTADVIYIALYCYKSLYLTGALYLLFFGMCIAGYAGWKKSAAAQAAIRRQEVATL
ncbi:MAG TPA: nicotinamide riboside transporter PnuC [Candidatus Sulfotelmatobacter sp.]|nr:nicotinamide riboside transporter PnuC [Candidatus Sulfotelmatobacter sp.]